MRFLALVAAALALLSACLPIPTPEQVDGIIAVIDLVTEAP